MALVYTPSPELRKSCPDFSLPHVEGQIVSRDDFSSAKVLVVAFICAHCPYVQAVETRLIQLARFFLPQDVQFVGICSNDWTNHPEDSPSNLLHRWKTMNYSFPYLIDADQKVAKDFGAVCTPDIFVYDSSRQLTYRGRIDDCWKDPAKVTRQELSEAIKATLEGLPLPRDPIPSMGCSIKWKQ